MKLSWRDAITTLLALASGVVVYAAFNYSWWLVSGWRGATLVLGALGLGMCITAAGDVNNRSVLNQIETWLGMASFPVIVLNLIIGSQLLFVMLAAMIGVLWALSTARRTRHSLLATRSHDTHHPAPVH